MTDPPPTDVWEKVFTEARKLMFDEDLNISDFDHWARLFDQTLAAERQQATAQQSPDRIHEAGCGLFEDGRCDCGRDEAELRAEKAEAEVASLTQLWRELGDVLRTGGMADPAFLIGAVRANCDLLAAKDAEIARLKAARE